MAQSGVNGLARLRGRPVTRSAGVVSFKEEISRRASRWGSHAQQGGLFASAAWPDGLEQTAPGLHDATAEHHHDAGNRDKDRPNRHHCFGAEISEQHDKSL